MTVTRPARLTGAALSGALALVPFVWILKDVAALGSPADLAWYWAGDHAYLARGRSATTLLDPVLLLAAAATAVAALRSRHAAAALAATGAVTLALRLPGLWAPGTGVLVTTLVELALAAGLLVTAAAGRRPPQTAYELTPTRPHTGPAVAAGILLTVAAATGVLWELYWAAELPAQITVDRFTGGRSITGPALGAPPGWSAAVLTGTWLAAGVSAFARARHTRALGLLAGLLLASGGLAETARLIRYELLFRFADAPVVHRLSVLTACYALLAGAAVLVLLAGRGAPDAAPGPHPGAVLSPPPPYPRPPGW